MQFIDKLLLNYAAVIGPSKDLRLRSNNFSNTATAFFIAYLIAEVPNAIILQFAPVAKWLGTNVVLWGIAAACTAAAKMIVICATSSSRCAIHVLHSDLMSKVFYPWRILVPSPYRKQD